MKIERSTRIVRSPGPVETTVGSEIVLMDVDSGKCFGLGETGSEIWRLIASPTTPAEAVSSLSREYDAPVSVIEQDVLEMLDQMLEEKLIQLC